MEASMDFLIPGDDDDDEGLFVCGQWDAYWDQIVTE
jgi:hypothetical protein